MGVALPNKEDSEFDDQPVSEINVTPLVDVMLVLLIVFMVAAPLMATGVPIDLPKAQTKPLNEQKPPIAVSVDAAGTYFVGATQVAPDQLLSTLLNQAENGFDSRIHVRADKELPYRTVLELMGQINAAGFTKVALVSEVPRASTVTPSTTSGSAPLDPNAVSSTNAPSTGPSVPQTTSSTSPAGVAAPATAAPPVSSPPPSSEATPGSGPAPSSSANE
jgi:biopolymer transport protein TolR